MSFTLFCGILQGSEYLDRGARVAMEDNFVHLVLIILKLLESYVDDLYGFLLKFLGNLSRPNLSDDL